MLNNSICNSQQAIGHRNLMEISSRKMLCTDVQVSMCHAAGALSTFRECICKGWGAAGLALVLLEVYANEPFLEVLVEPNYQGKSNRLDFKEAKMSSITLCKVYPNPTSGILLVEIPTEFEMVKAQLTDVTGRIVLQQEDMAGMATLNLRQLAPGSYTLQLASEDGKLQETHQIQLAK